MKLGLILGALLATAAQAEGGSIQFDQMPVGCRIFGTYGSGQEVIDEYVGRRGSNHIMKTYEGPEGRQLIRTTTFSAEGLMLRKDWAGGQWETFDPAACNMVPGDCTYTYRNGDGAEKLYEGRATLRGERLSSNGGFVGEPAFAPTVSTIGPFNLQESFTEGSTTFRVTKYQDCGLSS